MTTDEEQIKTTLTLVKMRQGDHHYLCASAKGVATGYTPFGAIKRCPKETGDVIHLYLIEGDCPRLVLEHGDDGSSGQEEIKKLWKQRPVAQRLLTDIWEW